MSHQPHGATPLTRHRCIAGAIALAAAVGLQPLPASGQVANLDAARKRLSQLENRIKGEEANAQRLARQLRDLGGQVLEEQGDLTEIRTNLAQTSGRITETQQRLQELRDQIRERARNIYKHGRLEMVNVILGADTFSSFMKRISYASALAERDKALVLESRAQRAKLEEIRAYQTRLESQQHTTVDRLARRHDLITDVFAKQQAVLADLAQTRGQALDLVERLESQLSASELANIKRVAGKGMTVSYGDWAEAFLAAIGAPVVRSNLVAVVAWEASEGTQATWNPLATTMPMPGATVYNSHGVRNYKTMRQGIDASIKTLKRPGHGYEKILDSLEKALKAMETGKAINKSDWCRGCSNGSYVIGIIPAVEKYYDRYAGE